MTRPAWEQALPRPTTHRVLAMLRGRGRRGANTHDLCQPDCGGLSFGTRIKELRQAGVIIDREYERPGSHRYFLRREPTDVVSTPSGSERGEQEPTALFEAPARPLNAALQDFDAA